MMRICAITKQGDVRYGLSIEEIQSDQIAWYWIDLNEPTEEEYTFILKEHFRFHPLAVEDCLEYVQRPKLDFYDGYHFLVVHAISREDMEPGEIDLFIGENFLVSFHFHNDKALQRTWEKLPERQRVRQSPLHLTHFIIDQLVDNYFPPMYHIEDRLNEMDDSLTRDSASEVLEEVFDIRADLSKMRRTIIPMRDLLYRILNSERFYGASDHEIYFKDIHDHLLKLTEMIEASRELTADIRDSYFSLNSNYMNSIMKTLTVFSTIFMPLTFIAGVYGMNFRHMPELYWDYGYYICLAMMAGIFISMMLWFHAKGWFK
ncbi:magnesium/cobalt transporter CorA [Ectobacillus ponti]|uniref:Magnesium transport protein CorA n=1 Tax=Ectobacillus ponti TaxID=2961894 RepID=A0AA42BNW2_9BACI|nr:magnesium/cobalt transporter CorA [Ectobacillus ponti]MCP8966954.1 magnesium/cobalt transporter CorA [Ectobacillus ponti]